MAQIWLSSHLLHFLESGRHGNKYIAAWIMHGDLSDFKSDVSHDVNGECLVCSTSFYDINFNNKIFPNFLINDMLLIRFPGSDWLCWFFKSIFIKCESCLSVCGCVCIQPPESWHFGSIRHLVKLKTWRSQIKKFTFLRILLYQKCAKC